MVYKKEEGKMKKNILAGLIIVFFLSAWSSVADADLIFGNYNPLTVEIGNPLNPTEFTLNDPFLISQISTWHYINPGTLENPGGTPDSLVGSIGLDFWNEGVWNSIGIWTATGTDSHWPDGRYVENSNWSVFPDTIALAGRYRVYDSVPDSWSHNITSGSRGFAAVQGVPVPEPATMLLLSTGIVGLVGARLRREKK